MKQTAGQAAQKQIELNDLVYAPLQAVSYANIQLSENIVDFLSATGDPSTDAHGKTTINLRTVQMMYEQMRNDADDNAVADSISLEVPLLSIYPLSTLKVAKSKVSFGAKVRDIHSVDGQPKIMAELSGGAVKGKAGAPQINFEVELEGVPAAEGLARFVDTLNSNSLPKHLARRPLDEKGNKLTGQQLARYEKQSEMNNRERALQARLAETDEMIRIKNNDLRLETGLDYEEFAALEDKKVYSDDAAETAESIAKYKEIKEEIEQSLEKLKEEQLQERIAQTQMEG